MKSLLVEGWRSSSHSYALVNQHQLLCLARNPTFSLYHSDVPFVRPEWEGIDAGFGPAENAVLQGLRPPPQFPVDRIYRISWPLRVHAGLAEKVFVFGTCEFGRFPPNSICGPEGDARGVDFQAVQLITSSRWSRDGFLAIGFKEEQVHTVPLGIDPSLFDKPLPGMRARVRADLNIPEEAFVFLNIGAMTWNKGVGPLVAAFARHRLKNENAILVLKGGDALYGAHVGDGVAEAKTLNPDVTHPKVAASIRYVPHNLTQMAMAGLYHASDVYVSPYRAEGFNLPALEALAAGLPLITTAGGATDDYCPADYCRKIDSVRGTNPDGYHLEPSVDSIVEHMQSMTDSAYALRPAAIEGSREIRVRYSWESVTRQLADLLSA
jgi:glycosyltransferase involved in cell wall biosynthesis